MLYKIIHSTFAILSLTILIANASESGANELNNFSGEIVHSPLSVTLNERIVDFDSDDHSITYNAEIDRITAIKSSDPVIGISITSNSSGIVIKAVGLTLYQSRGEK